MAKYSKKAMKSAAKTYKRASSKNRVFSADEIALVRHKMAEGVGHRRIFDFFVADRKRGKMEWALRGVKALAKRLKKGAVGRKAGCGAKRSARAPQIVERGRNYVEENPTIKSSSFRKIQKKFGLSYGPTVRVARRGLALKSLRRVKTTRLPARHKTMRAEFAKARVSAVDSGKLDPVSIFRSDEKLPQDGIVCSNPHNDRILAPKGAKKSQMRPGDICKANDGKWVTVRTMASIAVAEIGTTPPFFAPKGVKIDGPWYLSRLENNIPPSMSAIAAASGKAETFSSTQDGASSHKAQPVLKSIKKNTAKPFGLQWPSKSPDLNPRDFFLRGATQTYIDDMPAAPKSEAELKVAAHMATSAVCAGALAKAVSQVYARCQKVIEYDGGRFEFALEK